MPDDILQPPQITEPERPDLSGMAKSLTQRPPSDTGVPKQNMMPNMFNFIKNIATSGRGQVVDGVPQRPATKSDAFQAFLGDFLTSFSQGMGAAGTGPGANSRGFAAAMQAPRQNQLQNYALEQQAQQQQLQQQRENRLEQQGSAQLDFQNQLAQMRSQQAQESDANRLRIAQLGQEGQTARTGLQQTGANDRAAGAQAISQGQLDLARQREQRLAAGQAEGIRLKELGINTAAQFRTRIIQENVNGTPHNILINGATGDMIADLGEGKLAAADAQSRGDFQTLSDQFGRLSLLANSNPDAIGPLEGRMGQLRAQFIGGDPNAADLYSTAHDLQNQIIYLRSGKQINEAEFSRLMKALPDPNLPLDTFKTRLNNFSTQMAAIYRNRTGKELGGSTPAASTPTRPPGVPPEAVFNPGVRQWQMPSK